MCKKKQKKPFTLYDFCPDFISANNWLYIIREFFGNELRSTFSLVTDLLPLQPNTNKGKNPRIISQCCCYNACLKSTNTTTALWEIYKKATNIVVAMVKCIQNVRCENNTTTSGLMHFGRMSLWHLIKFLSTASTPLGCFILCYTIFHFAQIGDISSRE